MTLPRYEQYKPSNVEWLGEIPAHWEVTKAKFATRFQVGWTPPTGNSDAYVGDNLWANISDLGEKWIFDTAKRISDQAVTESRLNISPKGSLLFSFKLSIGQVSFAGQDMYTNEAIATFLPHQKMDMQFAYYTLPFYLVQNAAENIYGAKLLNQELIRSAPIVLPEVKEQTAIAEFLDRETANIDELVAEQRRLIDLLKEKRQAVISHAVTQGLNPNAPMKDSGIEWLGQVPAHWQIRSFRTVAKVVRGASPRPAGDPQYFGGDAVPWVTVAEITKDDSKFLDETEEFLTETGANQSRLFKKNTLVYSNSGATLGVPKILNIDACANDGVVGFEDLSAEVDIDFLYHFLSSITTNIREKIRQGSGQPNLNTDLVKQIRFAMPPKGEQAPVVEYIEQKVDQYRSLIDEAERAISLLQERRTALISAAVTGKIDVRGQADLNIPHLNQNPEPALCLV